MNKNFPAEWLDALERKFGEVNEIKDVQIPRKPKINVLFFNDLPEKGLLTAITCGLSNATHPTWKITRPELIVTLETQDQSWGLAVANFASAFFNDRKFGYGDIFTLDEPFSKESEMNGFLVMTPSFLDRQNFTFHLSDRKICLTGMYPIYEKEIEYYNKVGLDAFWHAEGLEINNPKRDIIKPLG
jgi:hypothetical protein